MPILVDYDIADQKFEILHPTHWRYFQNGDIVWFTFSLSFIIGMDEYMPEYSPSFFVRVCKGHADRAALSPKKQTPRVHPVFGALGEFFSLETFGIYVDSPD